MPTGPDAEALWRIDHQIYPLAVQRYEVLGRLRAQSAARRAAGVAAPPRRPGRTEVGATDLPDLPAPPPAPWPVRPARVAGGSPPPLAGVSLPNLLLGLGSALVVLAAIVFVAVSWAHLTAAAQGLVLVVLTATGMWGTRSLRRRGLTATAEAIAVVTLALLPVDAEAVREAVQAPGVTISPEVTLIFWCVAIAVMSGVSWWFGRFSATRAPLLAAGLAAQVPVPLFVIGWPVDAPVGQVVILAQAAVTLLVVRRAGAPDPSTRAAGAVALAGAGLLWTTATVAAFVVGVDGDTADRGIAALVVALAAAVVVMAAALWADDDTVRPLATGTGTGVALTAIGLALSIVAADAAWWTAMAAVAVTAMAAAVRAPRRWGEAPAGVAGLAAAVMALPIVVATGTTVGAALEAADPAWHHGAWVSTGTVADGTLDIEGIGRAPVLAQLVVAAGAALALRPRLGSRAATAGLAVAGMAGLVLLPLLVDVPLAATVSALLAGSAAACVALVTERAGAAPAADEHATSASGAPMTPVAVVAASGVVALAALGLSWAAAAAMTTVVAVAALGVLAGAVGRAAARNGDAPLAYAGAVVAVVAGTAEAGLVAATLGASDAGAWAAVALAAAGASAVGAVLDPAGTRTDLRGEVGRATEVVAAVLHVAAAVAVAGTGDPALTTVVLALGAATAAVHALRPGRRAAAAGAAVETLVLIWLRLAWADVVVPEAYTLPVAALLLAAAVAVRRGGLADDLPSWTVHGPWLVAAVAPTVLIAIDDPGLVRPLGGLVVGVVVLIAGAVSRTRAAVDVGAVTVAVLGLHQLSPVVAELPNWVTLGSCGVVLLATGATFEQRRRDLGILRGHYAELR